MDIEQHSFAGQKVEKKDAAGRVISRRWACAVCGGQEAAEQHAMTLQQLADVILALPEERRKDPARWMGEERGGFVLRASTLPEDLVVGDGVLEPVSAFAPEDRWELEIEVPAGTLVLEVD